MNSGCKSKTDMKIKSRTFKSLLQRNKKTTIISKTRTPKNATIIFASKIVHQIRVIIIVKTFCTQWSRPGGGQIRFGRVRGAGLSTWGGVLKSDDLVPGPTGTRHLDIYMVVEAIIHYQAVNTYLIFPQFIRNQTSHMQESLLLCTYIFP